MAVKQAVKAIKPTQIQAWAQCAFTTCNRIFSLELMRRMLMPRTR
nr:B313 [uncultured bacterium]